MKFISAAIALLASAAFVKSLPVYPNEYDETSATEDWHDAYDTSTESSNDYYATTTSDDYYPTTTSDDYYTTTTPDDYYTTTTPDDYYATTTSDDYYTPSPSSSVYPDSGCDGFTIKSPSGSDISWDANTDHEVTFDWGNSKIKEVEYVDLVKYEDQKVVDQWATGPYTSSNPTTGSHSLHIPHDESGYYQFLVYAATEEHHHCTYLSTKFKIVSNGYETTTTDYYETGTETAAYETETETATYETETETATYDYLPTSTESSSYDDKDFSPYSP